MWSERASERALYLVEKTLDIAYKKKCREERERDGTKRMRSMKIVVKVNGSNANMIKAESK